MNTSTNTMNTKFSKTKYKQSFVAFDQLFVKSNVSRWISTFLSLWIGLFSRGVLSKKKNATSPTSRGVDERNICVVSIMWGKEECEWALGIVTGVCNPSGSNKVLERCRSQKEACAWCHDEYNRWMLNKNGILIAT